MNGLKNILFIGDIVGRCGLDALKSYLPDFAKKYNSDLIIVNGENTSNGKGITPEEAEEVFALGAAVITTGNHIWDNWKSRPLLATNDKVLRPYNYPFGNPGRGFAIINCEGFDIAVLQLQGRTYMQTIDCPFRAADNALNMISERTKNIIVDFHAEATAEKVAMGWHLDGRVSAVIGTHTHIQTADACILPNGTAYITDTGMTGPYNSVVGLRKDIALKRLTLQTAHKYEMASEDVKMCGVSITIDSDSGQAWKIESFVFPEYVKSIEEQI